MNKRTKKHLKIWVAVLYIALACTCAFSSVLSYYSVTKTANASAQVKAFGVDATITAHTDVKLKPGTTDAALASVSVSGTPAVNATITYRVTSVTLGNWAIDGNSFYCPLVLNVFGTTINGTDYSGNADAFIAAIKNVTYTTATLPADTPLEPHTKTVTWSWALGETAQTALDSQLTTAATLNITVSATIEQVH